MYERQLFGAHVQTADHVGVVPRGEHNTHAGVEFLQHTEDLLTTHVGHDGVEGTEDDLVFEEGRLTQTPPGFGPSEAKP